MLPALFVGPTLPRVRGKGMGKRGLSPCCARHKEPQLLSLLLQKIAMRWINHTLESAETTLGPGSPAPADLLDMFQLEEGFKRESLLHSRVAGGERQTCTRCCKETMPGRHSCGDVCYMELTLPTLLRPMDQVTRDNYQPHCAPKGSG